MLEKINAHTRLGEILGEHISFNPSDTTIIALMRGAIFFAQGIFDF